MKSRCAGAARRDVSRLVVWQALGPTMIGVAIGVATAATATRLVAAMVYGVAPLEPMTSGVAVFVLITVARAATWLPARRATRMDPSRLAKPVRGVRQGS